MASMMNIPVLGIVENYSYMKCPHCGEKISVFGESHIDDVAQELGLPVLGRLPINPEYAAKEDEGKSYEIEAPFESLTRRMLEALG